MLRRSLQSSLVPQLQQLQQQQLRELTRHAAAAAGRGASSSAASHAAAAEEPQPAEPAQGHPLLQDILRTDLAAEEAAAALLAGQRAALRGRPDAAALAEHEAAALAGVRRLAPRHRVRPSLLAPALRATFFALGGAAALAPRPLGAAVASGLQDALTEVYTDQLRRLQASGLAQAAPDVRSAVRELRDSERAPDGAPPAPDLLPYLAGTRRLRELTPAEGLAGLVKLGMRLGLGLASRL